MSHWKLADFSVNVLSHGGFVEGRFTNEDKQANLSVSFEMPRDLEEITVPATPRESVGSNSRR